MNGNIHITSQQDFKSEAATDLWEVDTQCSHGHQNRLILGALALGSAPKTWPSQQNFWGQSAGTPNDLSKG